jgi:hypothetical protein
MSPSTRPLSSFVSPLQWALGLAIGLSCLGTASAQPAQADADTSRDPYYIGAGLGLTYESNVLHAPNNEQSDVATAMTLLGGVNKLFGRQRLYLDGNVAHNRYNDFKGLDNTSYGLNTGIDWATIGNLSGNVRYGVTQSLADVTIPAVGNVRNTQKAQAAAASARYAMTSRFALEGGVERRSVDYDQAVYAPLENTQNVVRGGVVYGLSGLLTFGVGLRASETETPRYSPAGADETKRKDVDFTVNWSPSGLSTFSGRLSVGKEDHTRATASDFSGVTGNVAWDYRPTGRLRFNTSLARDTGTAARFVGFETGSTETTLASESYRMTTTAQARANYALTGKIDTSLTLSRIRGNLVSSLNAPSGTDNRTSVMLGGTYKATRSVALSCRVGREQRSTNSALSTGFTANTAGCLATVTLR